MNATEEKLIQVIANHYLGGRGGKITIEEIARRADISRQAFNQYYSHLKPYAQGRKDVTELLSLENASNNELFLKSQKTIEQLKVELEHLTRKYNTDIEELKKTYVTSLMNNDIASHAANETRILAEKKGLQIDSLIKQLNSAETQLNLERENAKNRVGSNSQNDVQSNTCDIPLRLESAYSSFVKTGDVDVLESEKTKVCVAAINAINKKLKSGGDARVVIFIERYLFSYGDFLKTISIGNKNLIYCLKLPVYSRVELKSLRTLLGLSVRIEVYIPVTASVAIAKAIRAFHFRDVPESEFGAADKMDFPIIKDGFTKITLFDCEVGL